MSRSDVGRPRSLAAGVLPINRRPWGAHPAPPRAVLCCRPVSGLAGGRGSWARSDWRRSSSGVVPQIWGSRREEDIVTGGHGDNQTPQLSFIASVGFQILGCRDDTLRPRERKRRTDSHCGERPTRTWELIRLGAGAGSGAKMLSRSPAQRALVRLAQSEKGAGKSGRAGWAGGCWSAGASASWIYLPEPRFSHL